MLYPVIWREKSCVNQRLARKPFLTHAIFEIFLNDWQTFLFNSWFFLADLPRVKLGLGSTLDPDSIKEGDDVYFECSIDAKPSVYKIVWKFNVSWPFWALFWLHLRRGIKSSIRVTMCTLNAESVYKTFWKCNLSWPILTFFGTFWLLLRRGTRSSIRAMMCTLNAESMPNHLFTKLFGSSM